MHLAIYHYEVFGGKALATLIFGAYEERAKREEKLKKNTRKQHIYKENSNPTPIQTNFNLFLFLPFIRTVSNDVAALKPEKEQRRRQKKSNLKV